MKLSLILLLAAVLLAAEAVSGCTSSGSSAGTTATPTLTPGAGQTGSSRAISQDTVLLTVNGSVSNPLQLTSSDLDALPVVPVNMTDLGTGMDMNGSFNDTRFRDNGTGGFSPGGGTGYYMNGSMPSGDNGYNPGGYDTSGNSGYITAGGMPSGYGGSYSGTYPSGGMGTNASFTGVRDNFTTNVTGVSLNSLLDEAAPADTATSVTFIGMSGAGVTVPLSEIRASDDAAIVVMDGRMLEAVIPGTNESRIAGLTAIVVS